jgi:hypothetical protein
MKLIRPSPAAHGLDSLVPLLRVDFRVKPGNEVARCGGRSAPLRRDGIRLPPAEN